MIITRNKYIVIHARLKKYVVGHLISRSDLNLSISSLQNIFFSHFNLARLMHRSDCMSVSLCLLTYKRVLVQPDTLSASEDERLNAADAKQ